MNTSTVRAAEESERSRVIATLVTGFVSDPVTRWCWPDSESYLVSMELFANTYGGKAFQHGSARTDPSFREIALWLPPGEQRVGPCVAAQFRLLAVSISYYL